VTRRAAVNAMLKKYGSAATLGGVQVRAVIRPLQIQSGADGILTGRDSELYYRYTGPAEHPLAAGDMIKTDRRTYSVRRAGSTALGSETLYEWAVLRELPGTADKEIVLLKEDGTALARAKGYKVNILRNGCELRSWGEGTPAEIAEGETSYQLDLYGISPENGVSLSGLGTFQVEIRGTARREIYSGCRVKEESEAGGAFLAPNRSLLVLAAAKKEEALP
jgi:hypothetical protein